MKKLSLLIVTGSETQRRMLPMLLLATLGQVDCRCASTLAEGLAQPAEGAPDLVLIDLVDGEAAGTLLLAHLQTLHLEHKCLLLADVALWREWRQGPWANQVLLKGFSAAQLGKALNNLLTRPDMFEKTPV